MTMKERITALEARVCRIQEWLTKAFGEDVVKLNFPESASCSHATEVCAMRADLERILEISKWVIPSLSSIVDQCGAVAEKALASTSACPHATEVEQLRKLCEESEPYVHGYGGEPAAELAVRLRLAAAKGGGE